MTLNYSKNNEKIKVSISDTKIRGEEREEMIQMIMLSVDDYEIDILADEQTSAFSQFVHGNRIKTNAGITACDLPSI